jgi:Tol biopolymer transport system component
MSGAVMAGLVSTQSAIAGGVERHLVSGGGHYDGPDYSPDGAFIWFNSDRTGSSMDLWRIPTTGGSNRSR